MRSPQYRSLCLGYIAFWAGLTAFDARAGEFANEVWVNPGFYSQHFDRSARFRSDNWGVGAEWAFARNLSVGPSFRYMNWILPSTRAVSPLGDVASLSGRLDVFDIGIRLMYRLAL